MILFRAKKNQQRYFTFHIIKLSSFYMMLFYDLCVRIMMKKIFCWRWFCKILLLIKSLTKRAYFILPLTYCKFICFIDHINTSFGNCKHLQCCSNSIPCQSAIWFQSAWKISLNFSNNVHVLVHLFSFSTTIYHFASFFMLVIYQGYSVTINQMPILNSRGLKGNSILWSFLFSVSLTILPNP